MKKLNVQIPKLFIHTVVVSMSMLKQYRILLYSLFPYTIATNRFIWVTKIIKVSDVNMRFIFREAKNIFELKKFSLFSSSRAFSIFVFSWQTIQTMFLFIPIYRSSRTKSSFRNQRQSFFHHFTPLISTCFTIRFIGFTKSLTTSQ